MTEEHPEENLPQLLAALRAEYGVSEPQIAEAIGVSVSTVNTWASGKRGGKQGPRRRSLEALAAAYPKFDRERVFAAAQRRAPAPLDDEAEARLLNIFRDLTAEQRRLMVNQWAPVADENRSSK